MHLGEVAVGLAFAEITDYEERIVKKRPALTLVDVNIPLEFFRYRQSRTIFARSMELQDESFLQFYHKI